jgi:hypothetical protein
VVHCGLVEVAWMHVGNPTEFCGNSWREWPQSA